MATGMNALRLRGAKSEAIEIREKIEAIKEAFLSFYQIAAKVPNKESLWVGEDFEVGYLDAIMEISHG